MAMLSTVSVEVIVGIMCLVSLVIFACYIIFGKSVKSAKSPRRRVRKSSNIACGFDSSSSVSRGNKEVLRDNLKKSTYLNEKFQLIIFKFIKI